VNDASAALAIDLGGTRIKAGVVVGNEVVAQRIVPTEDERGFEHVLRQIISVGEQLLHEHPSTVVGLSLPAVVDVERGTVVDVRKNLSGLIGFPLADVLRRRFQLPVAVENDARMYGLGELVAGAGRGISNLVVLTLGTGVGCCVVLNGHILRGNHGTGSVLGGHMTIETYGPPCNCGNIGCVEMLCSAPALVAAMASRLARQPEHPLHAAGALTAEAVFAAAGQGDEAAGATLEVFVRHLGSAVASYVHVYDPDVVILGGGLMHASDSILPPVQQFVKEHTWTCPPRAVPVLAAELGDSAALVGAAALARGKARFF
jgi:glucokinase